MGHFAQYISTPKPCGIQSCDDTVQWLATSCGWNVAALTRARHGKPFPRHTTIPPYHQRARGCCCCYFPSHSPCRNYRQAILGWRSSANHSDTHMASNTYGALVDCCFHTRLVCGGTKPESNKPTPWDWVNDICPDTGTSDWGMVDT